MSLKKLRRLAREQRTRQQVEEIVATQPTIEEVAEPVTAHASAPTLLTPLCAWPLPNPPAKPKKRTKKPAPTVALEKLMVECIRVEFGEGVITKKWGVKERSLAKKLIETYSTELTEKVIKGFVAEWPNMLRQSRGRIYGLPTINFLWGAQDRFFGAAQLNQSPQSSPANIDEYRVMDETDDDW